MKFPVSEMITREIRQNPDLRGDTTGCDDNFAGGIITSLAMQLISGREKTKNSSNSGRL